MHLHLKASLAQFLIIIYEACQRGYVALHVDDDDMQIRCVTQQQQSRNAIPHQNLQLVSTFLVRQPQQKLNSAF